MPPPDIKARVNKAIDFIVSNLDQPLRLETVASRAHFSPFHFHRVFRAVVGENLNAFVNRLRLERALMSLAHDPGQNLTSVALACGFSSSSDFSRSFRKRYGVPPSAFDLDAFRRRHREDLTSTLEDGVRRHQICELPPGENPDGFVVELRDLAPRRVAYIRVLDPYQGEGVMQATQRLISWADVGGYGDGPWLGYMWDDPTVVNLQDCRYDVAVVVQDVVPEGEIGRFDFPAMRVAEVEIEGGMDLVMRGLDWLFGTWLPRSPYVPAPKPCFEEWVGRPFALGQERFHIRIQLPVYH